MAYYSPAVCYRSSAFVFNKRKQRVSQLKAIFYNLDTAAHWKRVALRKSLRNTGEKWSSKGRGDFFSWLTISVHSTRFNQGF